MKPELELEVKIKRLGVYCSRSGGKGGGGRNTADMRRDS